MLNGKYIGFIDSDDYIATNYVEKLLEKAFEKDADMVKCSYYSESFNSHEKIACLYRNLSVNDGLKRQILELNGFLWGAVIKGELFSNFRIPEGFWYEDMITRVIIYRKCKKFEFLDEPLYYYVQHESNISKKVERSNDMRCLDQYFLATRLNELSNRIGLENDEILYKILLNELGTMLCSRTRKLDKKVRRQVFLCACEFMNQFDEQNKVNLNKEEEYFENSFRNYNYMLWNLNSRKILLKGQNKEKDSEEKSINYDI